MATQTPPENYFAQLKQKIESYINDRFLLYKLQATKKISNLIAGLLVGLIIIFLLFFVLVLLSIAAGFYFASLVHSNYWGFGIVAAIYLALFLIIILFRKALIVKPILTLIIKILFDK